MNESEQQHTEIMKSDHNRVVEYLSVWERRIEQHSENTRSEGAFKIRRNGEDACEIHAFSYPNEILGTKVFYFLAVQEGNLVGMQHSILSPQRDRKTTIEGDIEVFKRGKGIASALEVTKNMLLQRRLDNDPQVDHYEYVIWDRNGERLEERSAMNSPDLVQSQKEREAWLSLYGEGGKMGFKLRDGKLRKVYSKGETQPNLGLNVDPVEDQIVPVEILNNKIVQLSKSD